MVLFWYILIFAVLFFLVFFWRKRYASSDSKSETTKAKKEDFNPEYSSEAETEKKDRENKSKK